MTAEAECDDLDFKQSLDASAEGDLLELIKDIVAMANSGGGAIIIGCLNNGHAVGAPTDLIEKLDSAILVTKINVYSPANLISNLTS